MMSPKNLFRLLLLSTLAFFAWTCNVSDSSKGNATLNLTVDDSLKTAAGKYDSIQIRVVVINGSDTSYSKIIFDGVYKDPAQLQGLDLGKIPSNDYTIILYAYRQGSVVLVIELPFTDGKAGKSKIDTLVLPDTTTQHVMNSLRMWLAPPDSGQTLFHATEGATLAFKVVAKDSNTNDTTVLLHFVNPLPTICGNPSYDTTSGTFSFKPAFACVDSGGDSVSATLKFMAQDKNNPSLYDTLKLSLVVLDSNSAPKWKENTLSTVPDKQGKPFSLALDSLYLGDAEGDSVSFTASLGTITQSPLVWSFTPSFSDSGVKIITLTATDNHHPPASSSIVLKLTVQDSLRPYNVIITTPSNGYVTRDSVITVHWSINGVNQTLDTIQHLTLQGSNSIGRSYLDTPTGILYSDSITVNRDNTPPNKPLVHAVTPTNNPLPTWTWASGGGGDGYFRHRLDTASFIDTVGTKDTSFTPSVNLAAGTHTLYVEERDDAGNWSALASAAVNIILGGPVVVITSPPNNYATRQSSVNVSWTLNGVAQPMVTKNLIEGSNTLTVVDSDAAGNKDTASVIVVRDTVPPNKPVVTGPGLTNSLKPNWTWHSGGNGGSGYYRYKLDASSLTDTMGLNDSSYAPATNLTQGKHVLYVEERDAVGNWSLMDSSGIATIDTAAPSIQITSPPNNYVTRQATVDVYWTLNSMVQAKVTKNLVEGTNILFVGATDSAGNKDSTSVTVVRDTVPPNQPMISAPGLTRNMKPTWSWTTGGNNGSGYFRVKFDDPTAFTDTNGAIVTTYAPATNLSNGLHTVYVQERDVAGNWSATSTGTATVDTIPPNAPKVVGPGSTNNLKPTWTWSTGGNGGSGYYRYLFDNTSAFTDTIGAKDSIYTPSTNLSNAIHTIYVQERDSAGNWSTTSTGTATVNNVAPVVKITSPANGSSTNGATNSIAVAWTVNGTVQTLNTTQDLTGLSGVVKIIRSSTDNLGNYGADSVTITVDRSIPNAPIFTSAPTNPTRSTTPEWDWKSGGGGNGTFQYQLDGATAVTTPSLKFTPTTALTISVTGTNHNFQVREQNAVGTWSNWASSPVVVKSPPLAPGLIINSALTNTPVWTWSQTTGSGGDGTFQFQVNGGTFMSISGNQQYAPTILSDNTYKLCVQEQDVLGWGADSCKSITVDKTAPTLTISAPIGPAGVFSGTPTATGTASDANGIASSKYSLNSGNAISFSISNGNWSFTPTWAEGQNTLAITIIDNAGNTTIQSITVYKYSTVVFVRKGATGNGTSWANAYGELSQALDTTISYSAGTQIWVSTGTYQPSTTNTQGFYVKYNLSIYGGFSSDGLATSLNDRNFSSNPTILGDISSSRMYLAPTTTNVIINGLTFENSQDGLYANNISAKIVNCVFQNFSSVSVPLEIDGSATSNVTVDSCYFINNSSVFDGAIEIQSGNATITNSTFQANFASSNYGAGLMIGGGLSAVVHLSTSQFIGNYTTGNTLTPITVGYLGTLYISSTTILDGGNSSVLNAGGTVIPD